MAVCSIPFCTGQSEKRSQGREASECLKMVSAGARPPAGCPPPPLRPPPDLPALASRLVHQCITTCKSLRKLLTTDQTQKMQPKGHSSLGIDRGLGPGRTARPPASMSPPVPEIKWCGVCCSLRASSHVL